MPGWRDFLDRFRPAGAPGAASPGGIPIDRRAAAAAELMPLLERLDPVQDEAEWVRAAAQERAARIRLEGTNAAAALVQQARESVEVIAAQAASDALRQARSDDMVDDPDVATEVTGHVAQRLPAYVDQVVAAARDLISELCAPASEAAPR